MSNKQDNFAEVEPAIGRTLVLHDQVLGTLLLTPADAWCNFKSVGEKQGQVAETEAINCEILRDLEQVYRSDD